MRVFVAGGSGAIGRRLVPLLVDAGHRVFATTRTPGKMDALRSLGAEPVLLDLSNRIEAAEAVLSARPEVVVHQMTALADLRSFRNFDAELELTNRLRTEGTELLLKAARSSGARRFVAQSYAGWPSAVEGGRVKTEEDPIEPHPPKSMARTLDAIRTLESAVTGASGTAGIALRYGSFYGPGTSLGAGGSLLELVRKRRLPIFGTGAGVWSFLHIDDAARATHQAIEADASGVFQIADDEPAEVSSWLPELARILDAKPPLRLPAWMGRLLIGEAGMRVMTEARGSSNAKAKQVLGWRPAYASWREGFRRGLG